MLSFGHRKYIFYWSGIGRPGGFYEKFSHPTSWRFGEQLPEDWHNKINNYLNYAHASIMHSVRWCFLEIKTRLRLYAVRLALTATWVKPKFPETVSERVMGTPVSDLNPI